MKSEFITVGKIINSRGLKGEVKLMSYLNNLQDFKNFTRFHIVNFGDFSIQNISINSNFVFAKLNGIDTIEDAQKLKESEVSVNREELITDDKNEFLVADIIGCKAYVKDKYIGIVVEIENYGSNDFFTITNGNKRYVVAYVDGLIDKLDVDNKIISLNKKVCDEVMYED